MSEPSDDGTCFFWDGIRCHYETYVIGIGGPCADCPDEETSFMSLLEAVRAGIRDENNGGEAS